MAKRGPKPRPLADRFWEKVDKRGPDDCWKWMAGKTGEGYGAIQVGDKTVKAHRVTWELINGPIPAGMCVLHQCDNPLCVNPAHLFIGTNADNSHDMVSKRRQARGEKNGQSELTEQAVHEVRYFLAAGYSQREIAEGYSVDRTTINCINTGKTWGWLT